MRNKLSQSLLADQVELLYRNARNPLIATFLIAPILVLVMWEENYRRVLSIWLLGILAVTVFGYYLVRKHSQAPQSFNEKTWLGLFIIGVFMFGNLWGMLGIFLSPIDTQVDWLLVVFTLVVLAGGALTTLSAYYLSYIIFVIPLLLPTIFYVYTSDIQDNVVISGLILTFLLISVLIARRLNHDINKIIMMRMERGAMLYSIEGQIDAVAEQHQRVLTIQDELRQANELFQIAFDATQVMYAYLDKDFNFIQVNRAYAEKVGKSREEFVGRNHFDVYPDDENKKLFEQVRDSGKSLSVEGKRFEHPQLGVTYWDWSLHPLLDTEGQVMCLLLSLIDVTIKTQAQQSIEEKETYLQSIMDATNEVILTMDASGKIEMVNSAVEMMFGYHPEELAGKQVELLMPKSMSKMHQHWVNAYVNNPGVPLSGRMLDTEGRRKDGTTFPVSISVSDNMIAGRRVFISVMRDITEQRDAMESLKIKNNELEYLSSHDSLTGLHNRRTGDEMLMREWNRAIRLKGCISVLMIDIDHFKKYNDSYGHQAGDNCLHRVAAKMKSVLVRPTDELARYGGEEFIAILPDTDQEGAMQVAENIRQAILELEIPNEEAEEKFVTVSIGTGTAHPVDVLNFEKLVTCADKALYQAKKQGRNRVVASTESVSAVSMG